MMDLMLILLLTLAGAVWRFIDGLSVETTGIATGLRNLVTIALAVTAAWIGGMGWWSPWAGGIAAASLMIGCTNWSNPMWQAIRFGGVAALAVLPFGMAGLPVVIAAIIGGLSYPALMSLNVVLPRFWLFDGWEAYARLVLGAMIIGGLTLPPLNPPRNLAARQFDHFRDFNRAFVVPTMPGLVLLDHGKTHPQFVGGFLLGKP